MMAAIKKARWFAAWWSRVLFAMMAAIKKARWFAASSPLHHLLHATAVIDFCLGRVEGNISRICAFDRNVVEEQVLVIDGWNAKSLQAAAQEAVLAAEGHVRVLTNSFVRAAEVRRVVGIVDNQGRFVHNLHWAKHWCCCVTVVDRPRLIQWYACQIGFKAIQKECSVRVGLDNPIMVEVLAAVMDCVPSLRKDHRVQPGAPLPLLGRQITYWHALLSHAKIHGNIAENSPFFTLKDAPVVLELHPNQICF